MSDRLINFHVLFKSGESLCFQMFYEVAQKGMHAFNNGQSGTLWYGRGEGDDRRFWYVLSAPDISAIWLTPIDGGKPQTAPGLTAPTLSANEGEVASAS